MPDEEPRQYFVRNDKGKVWGPLTFSTIELLVGNGAIEGRLQASYDGINFAFPGRFPDLRDAFPRELWGTPDGEAVASSAPPAETLVPSAPGQPSASPAGPPRLAPAGAAGGPPRLHPTAPSGPQRPTAAAPPILVPPAVAPRGAATPAAKSLPVVEPPTEPMLPSVAETAPASPKPALAQATVGFPTQGDLATTSPPRVYGLIAAGGATGKLSLATPSATYEIYFRRGAPEAARSDASADDLGSFLERAGAISAQALQDAGAVLESFGGDIASALMSLRLLGPADAMRLLADHAVGVLRRAIAAETGTYTFSPHAELPASMFPLGHKWGILCDVVRKMSASEAKRRVAGDLDLPVMKAEGRVPLEELRLNPQEARITTYFDGTRTPNQVAAAHAQDADAMYRLVYLLLELDLVSFAAVVERPTPKAAPAAATRPAASPPPPPSVAAKPSVPAPTKPPVSAGPKPTAPKASPKQAPPAGPALPPEAAAFAARAIAAGDDLEKLAAIAAELEKKDHFGRLGLTTKATATDIKAVYFQLAKCFHPDSARAGSAPEVTKVKSELFARISEAWGVLGDDKLRADYLAELEAGGVEKVDVGKLFAAEETFRKACIVLKARKHEEALKMFEQAIVANPNEAEFFAWRGYAKLLASKDRSQSKAAAMADIDKALRMNNRLAQAHYLAGQVHKALGETANAERCFQRAIAADPQHTESQSELRLMKMRK